MGKRKQKRGRRGAGSRGGAGRVSGFGRVALGNPGGRGYALSFRLKAVELVLAKGATVDQAARLLGAASQTIRRWVEKYSHGGIDALTPKPAAPTPKPASMAQQVRRDAVVALRTEHPEWGAQRIRDVLERFQALGVSETEVRRILHEAGLTEPRAAESSAPEREQAPRRFERAAPNQLWQSDIFTFLLRRHERIYLTAFMDDHSRFIVSYALAHHQRSELVMEALARGVAEYGTPEEILTDNGRQYAAWRGEVDFQRELRRLGVRHVRSRPQHPQTLGKVERFWKTLWDEFLKRTVFSDFVDCGRRLGLFIDGYNFQRPHQALSGLVPADRFFRAAAHVREAVEKSVEQNALRLSLEQPPRKPFYLVGRLGDRDLSIAATGSALRVQLGSEEPQTIPLPKEDEHETAPTATRSGLFRSETETTEIPSSAGHGAAAAPRSPTGAEDASNAFLVARAAGPGRDGTPALRPDLERAERRAAGDRSDRGGADESPDVLPARREGAPSDAAGADAGGSGGADPECGGAGAA